jgi:hypothetical protein
MLAGCAVFSAALALVLPGGCGRGTRTAKDAAMVDRFGTYEVESSDVRIKVWKKPKSLVMFDVETRSTGGPLFSGRAGSDAMRWFLYWSSAGDLWIYGEEGIFCWRKSPAGPYARYVITPDNLDLVPQMPQPVFERLPSCLREPWAPRRAPAPKP